MNASQNSPLSLDPAALRALADYAASQKRLKETAKPPAEELLFVVDVDIIGLRNPRFRTVTFPAQSVLDAALGAIMDSVGLFPDDPYCCMTDDECFVDPVSFGKPEEPSGSNAPAAEKSKRRNAADCKLADIFPKAESAAQIIAGPHGGWNLEIRLAEVMAAKDFELPLPCVCLDGDGADVFGEAESAQDYEILCDILSNPEHPRYSEVCKQLDIPEETGFDDETFDLVEVNYRLAETQISMAEEHFVPSNPEELRESYKSLLAELMARECSELVEMAHMARQFQGLLDLADEQWGDDSLEDTER